MEDLIRKLWDQYDSAGLAAGDLIFSVPSSLLQRWKGIEREIPPIPSTIESHELIPVEVYKALRYYLKGDELCNHFIANASNNETSEKWWPNFRCEACGDEGLFKCKECCNTSYCSKECQKSALGSNIGTESFFLSLTYNLPVDGYELLCDFVDISNELARNYSVPNVEFHCKDALEADLSNVALVFLDNQAWDSSLVEEVYKKLDAEMSSGSLLVDYMG